MSNREAGFLAKVWSLFSYTMPTNSRSLWDFVLIGYFTLLTVEELGIHISSFLVSYYTLRQYNGEYNMYLSH